MKEEEEIKKRTQPIETSERRRKKKKEKERKKEPSQRRQWRRKKEKWSKVAVDPDSGSLHVYLITKIPLKIELRKLKTAKICFQFP